MRKRTIALIIGATVILAIAIELQTLIPRAEDPAIINDVSRLNPTRIKEIVQNQEIEGLQESLAEARENNLKVSIAGKRHSMGGHTFYPGAVVLDMTSFNKVLNVDPVQKQVTVQSGATWDDVIQAVHPYNLSVPVLQDYSGFSVGGSLSVNVHQSDPHYGPIVETVRSFRLLLANGTVLNVSRETHPELFSLVIGGYGLFGIILDATLDLTENDFYEKDEFIVQYTEYLEAFRKIQQQPEIENVFARVSLVPDETLLSEVIVTTYAVTQDAADAPSALVPDKNLKLKKFIFDISRKYEWGKRLRWYVQKEHSDIAEPQVTSRNNLDYNNQSFLAYYSPHDTDILQEYFFPVETLPPFLDKLRAIVEENDLNLLSATIRYVPRNNESLLSYSDKADEHFGVVLYFNVGLSVEEQQDVARWTQELIDYTIGINGTYYLPYELYATSEQVRAAYPNFDDFIAKKRLYDQQELFVNEFYEKYAG